jgi:hypothetical protein
VWHDPSTGVNLSAAGVGGRCQAKDNVSERVVVRAVPSTENVGEAAGLLSEDGG